MEAYDLLEYVPDDIWVEIFRYIDVFKLHKISLVSKAYMGDRIWNLLRTVRLPAHRSHFEGPPPRLLELLSAHSGSVDELDIFVEGYIHFQLRPPFPASFLGYFRQIAPTLRAYSRSATFAPTTCTESIESLLNPGVLESLRVAGDDAWDVGLELLHHNEQFPKLKNISLIRTAFNEGVAAVEQCRDLLQMLPERARALEHVAFPMLQSRDSPSSGLLKNLKNLPLWSFVDRMKTTLESLDIPFIPSEFEILRQVTCIDGTKSPVITLAQLAAECNRATAGLLEAPQLRIAGRSLLTISMDYLDHHFLPIDQFKALFETYHPTTFTLRTALAIRAFATEWAYDTFEALDHFEYILRIIEGSPAAFCSATSEGILRMAHKLVRILSKKPDWIEPPHPLLPRIMSLVERVPWLVDMFLTGTSAALHTEDQVGLMKMLLRRTELLSGRTTFNINHKINGRYFVTFLLDDLKLFELALNHRGFELLSFFYQGTTVIEDLLHEIRVDSPQWKILMRALPAKSASETDLKTYGNLAGCQYCRDLIFSNAEFASIWAKLAPKEAFFSREMLEHCCTETRLPTLIKLMHIHLGLPESTSPTTLPQELAHKLRKELWTRQIIVRSSAFQFRQAVNVILASFPRKIPINVLEFVAASHEAAFVPRCLMVRAVLVDMAVIPSTKQGILQDVLASYGDAIEFEVSSPDI